MLDVNDGQIREFENEAAAQHDKVRNLVVCNAYNMGMADASNWFTGFIPKISPCPYHGILSIKRLIHLSDLRVNGGI
jgi:hypothetical protein